MKSCIWSRLHDCMYSSTLSLKQHITNSTLKSLVCDSLTCNWETAPPHLPPRRQCPQQCPLFRTSKRASWCLPARREVLTSVCEVFWSYIIIYQGLSVSVVWCVILSVTLLQVKSIAKRIWNFGSKVEMQHSATLTGNKCLTWGLQPCWLPPAHSDGRLASVDPSLFSFAASKRLSMSWKCPVMKDDPSARLCVLWPPLDAIRRRPICWTFQAGTGRRATMLSAWPSWRQASLPRAVWLRACPPCWPTSSPWGPSLR